MTLIVSYSISLLVLRNLYQFLINIFHLSIKTRKIFSYKIHTSKSKKLDLKMTHQKMGGDDKKIS